MRLQGEGQQAPILLGYSNSAIAAAAAILGDVRLSKGAILLRPLSPFPEEAFPLLDGYPILIVYGQDDARRDPCDGPSLDHSLETQGRLVAVPPWHSLPTAPDRRR